MELRPSAQLVFGADMSREGEECFLPELSSSLGAVGRYRASTSGQDLVEVGC